MLKVKNFLTRPGRAPLSSRELKQLHEIGLITLNGAPLDSLGRLIAPGDVLRVEGHGTWAAPAEAKDLLKRSNLRLFLANKLRGEIVTHAPATAGPHTKFNIFDRLRSELKDTGRLVSVGRLDVATTGLIVLTNDGALQRYLELPSTGLEREYEAYCASHRPVDETALKWLASGPRLGSVHYKPLNVRVMKTRQNAEGTYDNLMCVRVTEGKNREVRELLGCIGQRVVELTRTKFGPFKLDKLAAGQVAELKNPIEFLDSKLPGWRGSGSPSKPAPTKPKRESSGVGAK